MKSDLNKFVELYQSFGIVCRVNNSKDLKGYYIILACKEFEEPNYTYSSKLGGYGGFYTKIKFTKNGQFIKQEFYE